MSPIELIFPGETLALNPESSSIAHGYGLFETIRLREGYLELWERHWNRLVTSARELDIDCPWEAGDGLKAVRALARHLPSDAVVKLSLFKEEKGSRLVAYSRPVGTVPTEIGLQVGAAAPINEQSLLVGHKTHNYFENMLVLQSARKMGCFEAVRLNSRGAISEGAISNIFFFREGIWHTPDRHCGLLPGVVRELLLEIIEVRQGAFTPVELLSADAVFLTNASIGLQPVDWLLSKTEQIQLKSRAEADFSRVRNRLKERILDEAIRIS